MSRIAIAAIATAAAFTCTTVTAQQATSVEVSDWKKFMAEKQLKSIDIPIAFTTGAVTVVGVLYLRDPFDSSSVELAAAGAVITRCNLDKNKTECRAYDPTGNILRLVIQMNFSGKELKARLDTRQWNGSWSEGSWAIPWRQ